MNSSLRKAALAAACLSLGACATVTRGPSTTWEVATSPVGATVRTSNGLACDSTPCALKVSRRAHFTATISKPGYRPLDVKVSHALSTAGGVAFAGNVLVGGLIGAGVDVATGAMNDVTPSRLDLKLEPDGSRPFFEGVAYLPEGRAAFAEDPAPLGLPAFASARRERAAAGRVVDLRILPGGGAEEVHASSY